MRNLNNRTTDAIIADMSQAIKADDNGKFVQLINELVDNTRQELTDEQEEKLNAMQREADQAAMTARGEKPLTSAEQKFYTELGEAMQSRDPQQAMSNLKDVMPETVINRVFDDLRTRHPLLSAINFIPSGANIKVILNANGQNEAAWGELCDEIVTELAGGFQVVSSNLLKLSAFLPVCKQGFTFGPAWLDRYVRETLYEAIANGMEAGIVNGTGKSEPIGMTRQVGPGTTVTSGVYPKKAAVKVADFDMATMGKLISLIAADDNGKARDIRDLLLVCNVTDYYTKILPATQIMAPDGSYRSALPYNVRIVPVSRGLDQGEAVFGLGYRYFAAAGMDPDGNIEYSDHYRFLQDQRVYLIKAFANGFPMDGNAFLLLDVSNVQPARYLVQTSEEVPASDANLVSLKVGALAFDSAFDPSDTSYTASTTNASNVVKAVPADADAELIVKLNGTEMPNGTAAKWAAGSNTLTVKVIAADGSTNKTYTVTVTKS